MPTLGWNSSEVAVAVAYGGIDIRPLVGSPSRVMQDSKGNAAGGAVLGDCTGLLMTVDFRGR